MHFSLSVVLFRFLREKILTKYIKDKAMIKRILILLFLTMAINLPISGQSWDQIIKAVASDRATDDYFGRSVSISGDYAIVGAYWEDEDASGANTLSLAGAAYIFARVGETWTQQQKIVSSDRAIGDYFGGSVSISGDYAIVGAYYEDENASDSDFLQNAGSAYIFVRDGSTWTEQQKIVASDRGLNDYFGWSVSISGDYAIVGAYGEDEDVSGNNTLSDAGSAYIFVRDGTTWTQQQKIVASDRNQPDRFGWSVSISGDYAIVGAYQEFEDESGGNPVVAAGSAYIFARDGATWTQQQKIVASVRAASDNFGSAVTISGNYAVVGAPNEDEDAAETNTLSASGSAYIFVRDGATWTQQQKLVASDRAASDNFGKSISISGNNVIVGAYYESEDASGDNTVSKAGSAYIFVRDGASWTQQQKIVASDRGANDYFGYSVSMSGDYAIVGAFGEDEDVSGDNTLSYAGSVYIFNNPEAALPVELVSFAANFIDGKININWETATEVNNYGFEIERSSVISSEHSESRNLSWEVVGFIEGHGNSNSPKEYTFIDEKTSEVFENLGGLDAVLKYRLKQIDFDGKFEYSEIITVGTENFLSMPMEYALEQNYPNPFNPTTTIKYSIPSVIASGAKQSLGVTLKVYDMLGNEVATLVNEQKSAGKYKVNFDASNLASGIYFYKINTSSGFTSTKKLILMK